MGHYIFARIFKVEIKEFSIGMGPKLISRRSKKTNIVYSLRMLPIGGYVSMVGEDEESDNPNALCNKVVWQRMIITAAGSFVNVVMGILLMLAMILVSSALGSTVIGEFNDNAVSSEHGLMVDDKIVAINDVPTPIWNNVIYEIGREGTSPVDVTVLRNSKEIVLEGVEFGVETEGGIQYGNIDFKVKREDKNIVNVIKHTFYGSVLTVKMIWQSLADLISGKYGLDAVSGPIGVTTTIGDAAKQGARSFLYLCSVIAMNLGIFNLLPLPALDGGRLFFQFFELLRGKPINRKYEGMIHFAGIVLLMLLMVVITYKDILKLLV